MTPTVVPALGASCPVCRAAGPQTFSYLDNRLLFDVEHARRLVADGREPVELEPDDVRHSVETYPVNPRHVRHVDVKEPGILAHVWAATEQGEPAHGHRLIDGHHRAARCLELGLPFHAFLLGEDESRAVLLPDSGVADPAEPAGVLDHNRRAWNGLVARRHRLTRPGSEENLTRPLTDRWLPGDIAGKRVLLLAAGGGNLSIRFALAGAVVTVVDLSEAMLALDRAEAARRGLNVRVVHAFMDDLSALEPAGFDVVDQPVSTCYVPDVLPVYREVARVTAPGGVYLSGSFRK